MNEKYTIESFVENLENRDIFDLLLEFENEVNLESAVFLELKDLIWQEGVCYPDFYIVVPKLISIASNTDFSKSKDLWIYLGCWISTQHLYRENISDNVLGEFDKSLIYAEENCICQLLNWATLDDDDAIYLYASLFSFAKHRLGYLTLGTYKDDIVGTSIAKCPNGHINDFSVYNSGIVEYEGDEKPCNISKAEFDKEEFKDSRNTSWMMLGDRLVSAYNSLNIGVELKSHFELALLIIKHGVDSELDIKYAFSLYACLLFCNGSEKNSMRAFHAWDRVCCCECTAQFTFADGWCEGTY